MAKPRKQPEVQEAVPQENFAPEADDPPEVRQPEMADEDVTVKPEELTAEEAPSKQIEPAAEAAAELSRLSDHIAPAIAAANANDDPAHAGALEMLSVHVGEFLVNLRRIEGAVDGEFRAAIERVKAML